MQNQPATKKIGFGDGIQTMKLLYERVLLAARAPMEVRLAHHRNSGIHLRGSKTRARPHSYRLNSPHRCPAPNTVRNWVAVADTASLSGQIRRQFSWKV
jgi:hypothetical protein